MDDRRDEIGAKLLHGMPDDFEPAIKEATVAAVDIFRTLYGGPFEGNHFVCPICNERTSTPPGSPCPQCGRIALPDINAENKNHSGVEAEATTLDAKERRDRALRKLKALPPIQESILATTITPCVGAKPMGMSVDIHYGLHCEITDALIKAGCRDGTLLDKILEKFGTVLGAYYVILNNEHLEANPFYEIGDALEAGFDPKADGRFFSAILKNTKCGISYADASTVCEELGIEWPDEDEEG